MVLKSEAYKACFSKTIDIQMKPMVVTTKLAAV